MNKDERAPVMVIVHGFAEHKEYYAEFASLLGDTFHVVRIDLLGHGQAEGVMANINSFADYRRDLALIIAEVQKELPQADSFYLFGHSMGAAIAIQTAFYNPAKFRGLILSAPCIRPQAPFLGASLIVALLARLMPSTYLSSPVKIDYLTRDPKQTERIKKDPLFHNKITFRLAQEMIAGGESCLRMAPYMKQKLLLFTAGQEKIVETKKINYFFARYAGDKECIRYEEASHALVLDGQATRMAQEIKQQML